MYNNEIMKVPLFYENILSLKMAKNEGQMDYEKVEKERKQRTHGNEKEITYLCRTESAGG